MDYEERESSTMSELRKAARRKDRQLKEAQRKIAELQQFKDEYEATSRIRDLETVFEQFNLRREWATLMAASVGPDTPITYRSIAKWCEENSFPAPVVSE